MAPKIGRPTTAKSLKEYFATGLAQKRWKEGQAKAEQGFQGQQYDDGKYKVQLISAKSGVSQNGRVQNVFGFLFLDGDYKGQKIYKYQNLENETGISILLQDFKILGKEIDSPDEVDTANEKIAKSRPVVYIRIKTNGEFQNVYLQRPATGEVAPEVDEEEEEKEEEEEEKETEDTDEEDDDEDEKEEETEEDEDEEEEKKPSKPSKKKPADEEEEEADDDDDEDEDDEEEEKEEEKDEEEVTVDVGSEVKFRHKKETLQGKIVKIDEETEEIKVKLADGTKIRIPAAAIIEVLK